MKRRCKTLLAKKEVRHFMGKIFGVGWSNGDVPVPLGIIFEILRPITFHGRGGGLRPRGM